MGFLPYVFIVVTSCDLTSGLETYRSDATLFDRLVSIDGLGAVGECYKPLASLLKVVISLCLVSG